MYYLPIRLFIIACIVLCISACSPSKTKEDAKPYIVCTTGMIADVTKNLCGESAIVEAIMGPGVDPHLYKATQGDLKKLQKADIIIYNGLFLEGKMGQILKQLSKTKTVIAMAENVSPDQLMNNTDFKGAQDPHIWFDVALWTTATDSLANSLSSSSKLLTDSIKNRKNSYLEKLDSLDRFVKTKINSLAENRKILVTAHDAFGYYGRAYGLEVRGLQGISTLSEFGLKDVTDLVDYIVQYKIPAIFTETSVSDRSIKAVLSGCKSKGHDVVLGGSLFSDAMGPEGTFAGTYEGMVVENTNKIVKGLSR